MEFDLAKIEEALIYNENIFIRYDRDMMLVGKNAINNISNYTFKWNGASKIIDGNYLSNIIDARSVCIYDVGVLYNGMLIFPGRVNIKSINIVKDLTENNACMCLEKNIEYADIIDIKDGEMSVKNENNIDYNFSKKNGFLKIYKEDFILVINGEEYYNFEVELLNYKTIRFLLKDDIEIEFLALKSINTPKSIDIFYNKMVGNSICINWKAVYKTKLITASLSESDYSKAKVALYFNRGILYYDYNDLGVWFNDEKCNLERYSINNNNNRRVDLWVIDENIGNYNKLGKVTPDETSSTLDINRNTVYFNEQAIKLFRCYMLRFYVNSKYNFAKASIELIYDGNLKNELKKILNLGEITVNKNGNTAVMILDLEEIGSFKFYSKKGYSLGNGQWKNSKEAYIVLKENKVSLQFGDEKGPFNLTFIQYIEYFPSENLISKDNIYILTTHHPVCIIPAPPDVIITDPDGFASIFEGEPQIESTIMVYISANDGNKILLEAPGTEVVEYDGKIIIEGIIPEYTTVTIKNINPLGGISVSEVLGGLVNIILDIDGDIDIDI